MPLAQAKRVSLRCAVLFAGTVLAIGSLSPSLLAQVPTVAPPSLRPPAGTVPPTAVTPPPVAPAPTAPPPPVNSTPPSVTVPPSVQQPNYQQQWQDWRGSWPGWQDRREGIDR